MDDGFIEKVSFNKENIEQHPLIKGEYEQCTFNNIDFSYKDFSHIRFLTCKFIACDLSLAKLSSTFLQNVTFEDCKMIGLRFDTCNQFSFTLHFKNCNISQSCFYKAKLQKSNFTKSQLYEVDFTECDLTEATFHDCDLRRSVFERTILEKTDFRKAINYSIDPENNRIKKAKFNFSEICGLLDKYDIEIE